MEKTVLVFGEILWDIFPDRTVLGGAPLNFAYRLHSLGDRACLASRLGRDTLGEAAWEQVAALGIPASFIQWDTVHSTGTVRVTFDDSGRHDFVILPDVAYDYIEADGPLLELAATADCLYFGTLAQRSETSRQTLSRLLDAAGDRPKFLDINLRKDCYTPDSIARSLDYCSLLKLNAEEAVEIARVFSLPHQAIPDFCAAALDRWSLDGCVVTLGEQGAFAASTNGQKVYVPGFRVALVDTVGSGDAFAAGFLHQWLHGEPLESCCWLGNILGALVSTQPGATVPIEPTLLDSFEATPTEREIEESLKEFCGVPLMEQG